MAVSVLCVFLSMPWVGLWYVIVAFSGHTHLSLCSFQRITCMDQTCTSALDMYRLFNVLCWLWNIYEGAKNRVFIPPLPTLTRDISRHVQGLH